MTCAEIAPWLSIPVVILNAPVVTLEGLYRFRQISIEEARMLLRGRRFDSAIGHAKTAHALSEILQVDCPMRRIEFHQMPGQTALVFRLARRLEEGQVLQSKAEIEKIGFSFALLTRKE